MESLTIIKIGGNVIDNELALRKFLGDLSRLPGHKILVHGGGKLATELSARLGIETKMVGGRRITDEETIKVVTMTYAGYINKHIVALLQNYGGNAIGLSGADAHLIPAIRRPVKEIDYGWVGDIEPGNINTAFINTMLAQGLTPVIAPISCTADGQLLNINADTVAQALAVAMSRLYHTTLLYCFEKKGVLADVNDEDSIIPVIKVSEASLLKENGIISGGMIPKIDSACQAITDGVAEVVICMAEHILFINDNRSGYGTRIHQ